MFPFIIPAYAEDAAQEAAKPAPTWLEKAFEKFTETPVTIWIAIGVLIA